MNPKIKEIIPAGVDAGCFTRAMTESPSVSLKLNKRKANDLAELGYGSLEPVAWCPSGFYLDERPKFTLNPLLHAGVFYVQDASSMIHETIVNEILRKNVLPENPLVLDLCAAPGGKTTSMINALPDSAFVVANEVIAKRAHILYENLCKWGFPNTVVTNSRTSEFTALGDIFDIIAVDAPCSGEGMMRKDSEAVEQWTPALVDQCCAMQREILADAVQVLAPGGYLIYSTCTFNRKENEENVAWLMENFDLQPERLDLPEEWGIASEIDSPYPALRFMPHVTRGEGLFVAVMHKKGEQSGSAVIGSRHKIIEKIRRRLNVPAASEAPVKNRNAKGKPQKETRPDASEPLRTTYNINTYPHVELSLEESLKYLRHEAIVLPPETPRGFIVVTYLGHPMGFVKNIGNRANNLYPSEWRIRRL